MLYSNTTNTKFIYIYTILIEIFIGFTAFALFFGIFANYFYDNYMEHKASNDLNKALSFYQLNNTNNIINDLQKQNLVLKKTADNISSEFVKNRNDERNKFIYIIISITLFLFILIIIPLIIGIIPINIINIKFILINYLIHIIFIVGFETLLLLCVLPFIKSVKISESINTLDHF